MILGKVIYDTWTSNIWYFSLSIIRLQKWVCQHCDPIQRFFWIHHVFPIPLKMPIHGQSPLSRILLKWASLFLTIFRVLSLVKERCLLMGACLFAVVALHGKGVWLPMLWHAVIVRKKPMWSLLDARNDACVSQNDAQQEFFVPQMRYFLRKVLQSMAKAVPLHPLFMQHIGSCTYMRITVWWRIKHIT